MIERIKSFFSVNRTKIYYTHTDIRSEADKVQLILDSKICYQVWHIQNNIKETDKCNKYYETSNENWERKLREVEK